MKYADDVADKGMGKIYQFLPKTEQADEGKKKKGINRKYLINRLNYINFSNGTITVNLRHIKFENIISLQVKPLPCLDAYLDCLWVDTQGLDQKLRSYEYQSLVVPDQQKLISVEAALENMSESGLRFRLPEVCHEISKRKVKRFSCKGIEAQLIQNGAIFRGSLVDFNAVSFRIAVSSLPPQTFQWIDTESPVTVMLKSGEDILYTGECLVVRQNCGQQTRTYVVKPLNDKIRRFKPKEYRSTRHKLVPSPNIIFIDPFSKRTVNLKVVDLSGSGFSVEEDEHSAILLPGKIIPELFIDFANILHIKCRAQVVYRKVLSNDSGGVTAVRCGMTILDMDIQDHIKLLAILYQTENRNSYICSKIDLDDLWEFFFETGFVYPKKYSYIEANKEKFKQTYERLYTKNPNIARHFVFQEKGIIYAHMAMFRFYENTWLIHHHASRKTGSSRAGLIVLDQLSRSINDSHSLFSAHMQFVSCYYRPENKFPNRVFGGLARYLNNPKGCSVDNMAYFHFKRTSCQWDSSGPWSLEKTRVEDLLELENYYEYASGGLMLHAQDLEPGMMGQDTLSKEYHKLGFKKEKQLLSLKKEGNLKAIILVNVSDIGLNMSELTNCAIVFVLDEENLPKDTLYLILSLISVKYERDEMSVLVYPSSYADRKGIICEKNYTFFVLNLQCLDSWFRFSEKMMRHNLY